MAVSQQSQERTCDSAVTAPPAAPQNFFAFVRVWGIDELMEGSIMGGSLARNAVSAGSVGEAGFETLMKKVVDGFEIWCKMCGSLERNASGVKVEMEVSLRVL